MNLLGSAVPALASLLTVPYIVRQLGNDSYGVFVLVTAVIGYFALLDINVTSGSVKFVAEHNILGERQQLHEVVTLGAIFYFLIGLAGCLGINFCSGFLTCRIFMISPGLMPLATKTLRVASLGFLVGQLQIYLNSVPQSLQRYDLTAKLEAFFGSLVPLMVVGALWMGYGLLEVVVLRILGSVFHSVILLLIIKKLIPDFKVRKASKEVLRKVSSFSGYAYLNRIASVSYANADRLVIGMLINMSELTFYTVPVTLVNRVLGITLRLGGVLYPLASELGATNDYESLERIYLYSTRYLFYVNTSIIMLICMFAYPILRLWIGEDFAEKGQVTTIIIAAACLIDSLTSVPSVVNDGLGYPKKTGLFAVTRAAVGLLFVFLLTSRYGILGTALAHLISAALVSSAFLFYIHRHSIRVSFKKVLVYSYFRPTLIALVCFGWFYFMGHPKSGELMNLLTLAGEVVAIYLTLGFFFVVQPDHRRRFSRYCVKLFGFTG